MNCDLYSACQMWRLWQTPLMSIWPVVQQWTAQAVNNDLLLNSILIQARLGSHSILKLDKFIPPERLFCFF